MDKASSLFIQKKPGTVANSAGIPKPVASTLSKHPMNIIESPHPIIPACISELDQSVRSIIPPQTSPSAHTTKSHSTFLDNQNAGSFHRTGSQISESPDMGHFGNMGLGWPVCHNLLAQVPMEGPSIQESISLMAKLDPLLNQGESGQARGDTIPLAQEPLKVSITKSYDSWMHDKGALDPLRFLNYLDSPLSFTQGNFDAETLLKTREILTRIYIMPRDKMVVDLYSTINEVLNFNFEPEKLVQVDIDGELQTWGFIFLAITQILSTYNSMFFAKDIISFRLDPDYRMLSILELLLTMMALQGYVTVLQTRVMEARDRISDIVQHLQWSLELYDSEFKSYYQKSKNPYPNLSNFEGTMAPTSNVAKNPLMTTRDKGLVLLNLLVTIIVPLLRVTFLEFTHLSHPVDNRSTQSMELWNTSNSITKLTINTCIIPVDFLQEFCLFWETKVEAWQTLELTSMALWGVNLTGVVDQRMIHLEEIILLQGGILLGFPEAMEVFPLLEDLPEEILALVTLEAIVALPGPMAQMV
ncbi:hypothetical protein C8J56DRAFT_883468 [Mycena floridula]|nr:hypothetical protein C8J56DRAFT_883468 [Mycena floridula]